MLEYIFLGFFMYGEMSGYDLKQKMAKSTSNFFDASFGSIYPALKRLEGKGHIISREIVDGGKFKKVYAISGEGRTDFLNWLEQPIELSKTKPDYLVKVFFLGLLPKEKAIASLEAFIGEVEPVAESLREKEAGLRENEDIFPLATLQFGIRYYDLVLDWSNCLLNRLRGNVS